MQTLIRLVRNGGAVLAGTCVLILLLEVSLRPAAYFWHGRSEYYLYYGFHSLVGRVGINPMTTFQGEYYQIAAPVRVKGRGRPGFGDGFDQRSGLQGPGLRCDQSSRCVSGGVPR